MTESVAYACCVPQIDHRIYGPAALTYLYPATGHAELPKRERQLAKKSRYQQPDAKPVDSLPSNCRDRDAVLPMCQRDWTLVSTQLYVWQQPGGKRIWAVRVAHSCGTTRYIARAQWIRGARDLGKMCFRCFRPTGSQPIAKSRKLLDIRPIY